MIRHRLVTERLELRPLQRRDAARVFSILSQNADIRLFLGYEDMHSQDDARRFLDTLRSQENRDEALYWSVIYEGALVGMMYFVHLDLHPTAWAQKYGMLGYWLDAPARNKGLATEAAEAAIEFGFSALKLHKIKIGHATSNAASQRVIRKLGFHLVGQEENEFYWHGCWMSHAIYEMLADVYWTRQYASRSDRNPLNHVPRDPAPPGARLPPQSFKM